MNHCKSTALMLPGRGNRLPLSQGERFPLKISRNEPLNHLKIYNFDDPAIGCWVFDVGCWMFFGFMGRAGVRTDFFTLTSLLGTPT